MSDTQQQKFKKSCSGFIRFVYKASKIKIETDKRRWDLLRRLEARYRFGTYLTYYFNRNYWEYLSMRFKVENVRIPLLPYQKQATKHNERYRTIVSAKQALIDVRKLNDYDLRILKNCKKAFNMFERKIMEEILKNKQMPTDVKKAIVHAIRLIHSLNMRIKDHEARLHMMNNYIDTGDIRSFMRLSEFYFEDYSFYFPLDTFEQRLAYHTHENYFVISKKLDSVKKATYVKFSYVGDIIYALMLFAKIKELFLGVRRELV